MAYSGKLRARRFRAKRGSPSRGYHNGRYFVRRLRSGLVHHFRARPQRQMDQPGDPARVKDREPPELTPTAIMVIHGPMISGFDKDFLFAYGEAHCTQGG